MTREKRPDMALVEFFENHYRPKKIPACAAITADHYKSNFRRLGRFLGHSPKLSDLNDDTLSGYMAWITSKGRSPRTVNKARDGLIALWRYANRRQLVETWPDVSPMPEYHRAPIAWTPDEFQLQLDALGDDRIRRGKPIAGIPAWIWWSSLLISLYDTGARVGAMLKVRREHYQPELRRLILRAENQKHRADQVFMLDEQTATLLAESLQHNETDLLFPWSHNRLYLWNRYKRILQIAGLSTGRDSGFHRIRKTTATMAELHIGRGTATRLLGHSSAAITEKYIDRAQLPENDIASKLPRPRFGLPGHELRVGRFPPDTPVADVLVEFREHCRRRFGERRAVGWMEKMFVDCGFKTIGEVKLPRLTAHVETLREDLNRNGFIKARQYVQRFVAWLSQRMPTDDLPAELVAVKPTPESMAEPVREARKKIRESLARPVKLCERHQAILRLLCCDYSPMDISIVLKVSNKSIWDALTTIRFRVGVRTNHGLAIWAARNGLAVVSLESKSEDEERTGAA